MGAAGLLHRLRARDAVVGRTRMGGVQGRRARPRSGLRGDDPAPGARDVPGDVRDHHPSPHLGRDRGAHAFPCLRRVHPALGYLRLRPAGALGLGGRRVAAEARCARLRGRHGGAHQRRRLRPGGRAHARAAQRLQTRPDRAAQRAAGALGRGTPVVRLVRLQCRLGARRERPGGAGVHKHQHGRRGGAHHLGVPRPGAHGQGHGRRCGDRARGRPRRDHARRRLHHGAGVHRGRCAGGDRELHRDPDPRHHPARRFPRRLLLPRSGRHGRGAPDGRVRHESGEPRRWRRLARR